MPEASSGFLFFINVVSTTSEAISKTIVISGKDVELLLLGCQNVFSSTKQEMRLRTEDSWCIRLVKLFPDLGPQIAIVGRKHHRLVTVSWPLLKAETKFCSCSWKFVTTFLTLFAVSELRRTQQMKNIAWKSFQSRMFCWRRKEGHWIHTWMVVFALKRTLQLSASRKRAHLNFYSKYTVHDNCKRVSKESIATGFI